MSTYEVAIVGGGLVGALEACLLARRNYRVTLFESRRDGRNETNYYGRSINLAISLRGISALERIGMGNLVQELGIPMQARMIHTSTGVTKPIPYDANGRCINSIERAMLNNKLLNEAELLGVKLVFNHKLVDMNADEGELAFRVRRQNGSYEEKLAVHRFDWILGCDGARSTVRSLLSRVAQMEVSQMFIEHGYLELRIDPNADGSYKMPANYLHIWPRGEYMMIALPNKDASFTCTLFMPFSILESNAKDRPLELFERNFPDAIELIGGEQICKTLAETKASSLISIDCKPYFYKHKVALLGDSAHAMPPFYGQGMNCGFEDCLVLDEILDKLAPDHSTPNMAAAFEEYSRIRCPNGKSMCKLAMYNYVEMRHLVNTWSFIARKRLDDLLHRLAPNSWIPLYTMVTFSRIPIDECTRRSANQDRLVRRALVGLASAAGCALLLAAAARYMCRNQAH